MIVPTNLTLEEIEASIQCENGQPCDHEECVRHAYCMHRDELDAEALDEAEDDLMHACGDDRFHEEYEDDFCPEDLW